jgi:hypothetical protein
VATLAAAWLVADGGGIRGGSAHTRQPGVRQGGTAYTGSYAAENEDGIVEVEVELDDELDALEVGQVRGAERQVEERAAERRTKKKQRRRKGRKQLTYGRQKRRRQGEEEATPSTPTRAARSLQPQMGTPVQAGSAAITRQGAHTPLRHARLQGPRVVTPIPHVAHPTLVVNVTMAGMQRQYRMPRRNTVGGLCRAVHQAQLRERLGQESCRCGALLMGTSSRWTRACLAVQGRGAGR